MPSAITPTGIYTIQGATVKVHIVLRRNDKPLVTLSVEAPRSDLPALTQMVTAAIAKAAHKL